MTSLYNVVLSVFYCEQSINILLSIQQITYTFKCHSRSEWSANTLKSLPCRVETVNALWLTLASLRAPAVSRGSNNYYISSYCHINFSIANTFHSRSLSWRVTRQTFSVPKNFVESEVDWRKLDKFQNFSKLATFQLLRFEIKGNFPSSKNLVVIIAAMRAWSDYWLARHDVILDPL